ncbi:DUF2182 domain-containing protein [Chryseobacterium sp. Leaf201]|uniref:copper chaperone n=1 Tax=Chryseobacterium sp. Leaf201 TaxID=1735672 RepID=UPI000FF89397|nr:DUF2182 domain-containing protein [Chryseobacterium sp. Leaf201]
MKMSFINRNLISLTVIGISVVLWVFLLWNPGDLMTVKHCHVTMNGGPQSFKMLLEMNPLSDMMAGWILMVFAMMLPKLIVPLQIISEHTFKHMRFLVSICFITGYALIWILIGFLINIFILLVNANMPNSYIPAIVLGLIALIWQFSPVKQKCLNKGHSHPVLAAWGIKAYTDAFSFGLVHGLWCVGAGWALMLFPMLLPEGHHIAMLVVTFIMLSEHMEHPRLPRWRISFRLKLLRIITSQNLLKS